MKVMVTFAFPTEFGNEVVRSGKIQQIFGLLMEDLKPEAVYLFPEDGLRGGLMVVDLTDSSQVADVAERFWHGLRATVTLTPVMGPDDLMRALSGIGEVAARYA
jgi:hypothetical protein